MDHPTPRPVARPSAEDGVAAAASELIGGPIGRRAVSTGDPRTPLRVVALVMIGMFALGMAQKASCYHGGWFSGPADQYTHACYSDIPHLYGGRGFADGLTPYFDRIPESVSTMEYLEYPVLTGLFMQVTAWLTPGSDPRPEQLYWLINSSLLMVCAVVLVICVSRTHARRPWDGMLVALSPALALTATINWDLLAVALAGAGLLMWSRSRPLAAGLLIGLATAAKLYPALLLGPLLLLCWRAGKWRPFLTAAGAAVTAWLAVNLPVAILATEGWAQFYTFSRERPVDFGSFWLIIAQRADTTLDSVNVWATLLVLLGCAALAVLTLSSARRPRLGQLAFLVVALFVITNKVYSPQYVLWLIPLAALARPRWRDILIWQACEVLYFIGIWMYLAYLNTEGNDGLPTGGYQWIVLLHLFGTLYLCVMVVRDILRPAEDPVRQDGSDDPGGGVLDGAADRFTLRRPRPVSPPPPTAYAGWGIGAETTHPTDVSRET
ncbi:glycosyltransferase 87 family protein [Streptomyces sp. RFCAC02]|uniref:glycosyltransferase family 87 protein n=1 Tax=Streptomyces sp. RFCAC02 TaxID=2499143 RepID=UPI00101F2D60|nr:glycosyltransferase 87 family protein [Streptomyces sp. RFCAC02]